MKHTVPGQLLGNPVMVYLIGAGGNGSQMLTGLARLDTAIRALGHPGLKVKVWDADTVTEANIGRQLFSPADIGQHKARVLVHRLNSFYGLEWEAECRTFAAANFTYEPPHIIIGCVDTRAARREIAQVACLTGSNRAGRYWLDLGNESTTGQVILGGHGLPTVMDRHPEIRESKKEVNLPSCSLALALEKQDLFINQAVTTWGLHLLWTMFKKGGIDHCGYYINLTTGRVTPVPVPDKTIGISKQVAPKPLSQVLA